MTSHMSDAPALIRYSVTSDGMLQESPQGPVVPFVDVQQLMGIICQALAAVNALQTLLNSADFDKAACFRELEVVRTALASACVARAALPFASAQEATRPPSNGQDMQKTAGSLFRNDSPAGNFAVARMRSAPVAPAASFTFTSTMDVK